MNLARGLHRLGSGAYRHPWRVIAFWVVVLAALGTLAGLFYKAPSSSISIPGTPGQMAIDRVGQLFPDNGGGSGRIVFHSLDGKKISDYKADIEATVTAVGKVDGVSQAVSPFVDASFVSGDGTIAYAQVGLDKEASATSEDTFNAITKVAADGRQSDLQVEIGGDLVSRSPGELIGAGEVGGVVVALIVLVITLGSLVAAGMPLLSALLGVGVSMAGLFALSRVVDVNSTTPVLAVMLGLAVGIDYALFIISKYRGLVLNGVENRDAAARALGTAGNAVVFAAFTVIIALAALSIVNIPFMTTMGLAGAVSIAVAAVIALTLTPAFLGLAKNKVFGRRTRRNIINRDVAAANQSTVWYRWGRAITRHPVPVLVVAIGVIAVIALPARDLTLGLPTDQYAAPSTTQKKAYDLLTEGFGAGFNGPLVVVVEGLPKVSDADRDTVRQQAVTQIQAQAGALAAAQQGTANQAASAAAQVAAQARIQQQIELSVTQYAKYVQLQKVAARIAERADVEKTTPALVTDDGSAGIIQVIPKSAPSGVATKDLITDLRNEGTVKSVTAGSGVTLGVTGTTALQEDINTKLANALPLYLLVVVGLSLLLLVIAFRSILVPLKATLGFLLSVLAMFGAMVAVFQWGWFGITDAPGPIVSFIPIIAIGILFGLAMDYEFFLVSSMHEAYGKSKRTASDAREAVRRGFGAGSRVVTAAAIIMISVFAGFIFSHDATIQSIGFGLATGILVDAFLVRMTIVPAVMTLLGRSAWWLPKWLDRILPHVSIEGEDEKDAGKSAK